MKMTKKNENKIEEVCENQVSKSIIEEIINAIRNLTVVDRIGTENKCNYRENTHKIVNKKIEKNSRVNENKDENKNKNEKEMKKQTSGSPLTFLQVLVVLIPFCVL
eukprot:Trichotokara_eunicae@DN4645_c0_g1_i6.p1